MSAPVIRPTYRGNVFAGFAVHVNGEPVGKTFSLYKHAALLLSTITRRSMKRNSMATPVVDHVGVQIRYERQLARTNLVGGMILGGIIGAIAILLPAMFFVRHLMDLIEAAGVQ
jgi:hypothetical protein